MKSPWVVLQQDGALPHWGLLVHQFLDAIFSKQWIGRDGQHVHQMLPLWTFFLWSFVKDKAYSTPVPDTDVLKARIRDASAAVSEEIDIGENMERNRV
jgi:hypothetical protein